MRGVQWENISLEGFGPFGVKSKINLKAGLNLLVAPNETGKSTIAEGLRAIIFGLPNSKDPIGFSTARFRSWQGGDNFAGEVSFLVDGERYRITRQFDKHKVVIEKEINNLWETQLETEHNPSALKAVGDYQGYLDELFGLTNGKIFADTFYMTQPLPENDKLSEELRTLLSGSGSDYGNSLKILEDEMADLTRFLKERGFPRNKNNDRKLEELEVQILNLENELRQSSAQMEELQIVLAETNQVAVELKHNGEQYQNKKALHKAWQEGRRLKVRYEELLEKQVSLAKTKEELLVLGAEIKKIDSEMEGSYKDFLELAEEFPDELEQLLKWEEEVLRLTENTAKLKKDLEEQQDSMLRLSNRLMGFYHFQQNPHFLVDFKVFKRTEEKFLAELEEKKLILEELAALRAKEESKGHSRKVFLKRIAASLIVAVIPSLVGGQIVGSVGVIAGFIAGGALGWGLSYLFFGDQKKALLLPQTKSFLAGLARQDFELTKAVKELSAAELMKLILGLDALLKQKKILGESQEDYQKLIEIEGLEALNSTSVIKLWKELVGLTKVISPYHIDIQVEAVEKDYLQYDQLRRESNFAESVAIKLEKEVFQNANEEQDLLTKIKSAKEKYPFLPDPLSGKTEVFKEYWRAFQSLKSRQDGLISELQGILKGAQVKDMGELDFSFHEVQNQVIGLQNDLADLGEKHPGLPVFIGSKTAEWGQLEETYRSLERMLESFSADEGRLLERQQELKLRQIALEGKETINIAQGELRLSELKHNRDLTLFELDALEIACQELKGAINDYNLSYRERLGEQITYYFNKFTDSRRTVTVTEDFEIRLIAAGQEREVHQFSQGTKDLLFFALRLAVGDLLAEDFQLPFVLDDPFLNYDQGRLGEVKKLLHSLAEQRQIFLLSHRQELVEWGNNVIIERL